jgi:hypothetical protein
MRDQGCNEISWCFPESGEDRLGALSPSERKNFLQKCFMLQGDAERTGRDAIIPALTPSFKSIAKS